MNIVFLNTLEKQVEEGRVKSAQVSIGETQGVWQIGWSELDSNNGKSMQESWYQGLSWDEMLSAFRMCLREKIRQGFRPLVSGEWESVQGLTGKARMTQMLAYYADSNSNEPMYENLRKWRREQAAREGKAPYILATNRVLRLISVFLPQTVEELKQIPGFGEHKANMYGADICKATVEIQREKNFPLEWVAREVDQDQFESWVVAQKEQKVRMELDKEANKRKLLELVSSGTGLSTIQETLSIPRRELLLWIEDLDREGYDMDTLVEVELQSIQEEDQIRAWSAFETEGDRYLKPVLQKVYGQDELKDKDLDRVYEWLRLLRLRFRREKENVGSSQAS
jgi:hypothetical protein